MPEPERKTSVFFGSLEERLEHSLEYYVRGGGASLSGAIFALSAVHAYVRKHAFDNSPDGDRLLRPLDELVVALLELECGKSHPFFQIDKAGGGSALLISESDFQTLSCFVVKLLEHSGAKRDQAMEHVARSLTKSGFRQTRKDRAGNLKDITVETVKGWFKSSDRIFEIGSAKEYDDIFEFVRGACRGFMAPAKLQFEGMAPSVAAGVADLILDQAIPVRFAHLRPGAKRF